MKRSLTIFIALIPAELREAVAEKQKTIGNELGLTVLNTPE